MFSEMLSRVPRIKLDTHCVVCLSCAGRTSDPAQIILLTLAINYVSEVRYFCLKQDPHVWIGSSGNSILCCIYSRGRMNQKSARSEMWRVFVSLNTVQVEAAFIEGQNGKQDALTHYNKQQIDQLNDLIR